MTKLIYFVFFRGLLSGVEHRVTTITKIIEHNTFICTKPVVHAVVQASAIEMHSAVHFRFQMPK